MTLEILALLFSLSMRSANLPNVPYDYEIASGIETKYSNSSYFSERENGKYYYGFDSKYDFKYVKFTNYKRTSKNIDNQKLSLLYPFGKVSLGVSCGTKRWKNPQSLLTVVYKSKYIDIDYSRWKDNKNIEIDIKYNMEISKRLSLVPLIVIKEFNDKTFWQMKLVIKFKT